MRSAMASEQGIGPARRRFLGMAAALWAGSLGALTLSACGQRPAPTSKGQVTVRLATDWLSGARGETMKVAIPAFQERYPNIKIEVEAITGDYWTTVNTQLAAGTIQEVLLSEGNFFQSFKDQGAFTAIDAMLRRDRINMADYSVVPGIYQDKGKQYGMPFQLVASGWFYNRDLFRERGLKEPDENWTWNDVLSAAQALTQPTKPQYGIWVSNNAQFCWGPLLFSAGARWYNAEKTKMLLASQGGLEAFQWVVDLIHKYRVSPTPQQVNEIRGNFPNPFMAGKIAMFPTGLQAVGNTVLRVGDQFRWGIMPTPKHPKTRKTTHLWSDQPHMVTNAAQKKNVVEEATKLVVFLAGELVQGRIAVDRGSIPVLKKLQTSAEYLKPPPDNMRQVSINLRDPDIQTPGFMKGWDEWWAAINRETGKAFTGEVVAQQALQNAVRAGEAVLARYGPQR